MRCFLGFDVSARDKMAIEHWRDKVLPPFERPVPASNFHVTSVFLGNVSEAQLEQLSEGVQADGFAQFSLRLNQFGYWSKPKILWLGTDSVPTAIQQLTESLASTARTCGIPLQERPYQPHVTLVRKITPPIPTPLLEPDFELRFDTVHLFESVSTSNGVQYPIRMSWPLSPLRR